MNGPIPYGRQQISDDDINAVIEVLKSDFLTQGPKIDEFERTFAQYIGCKYAVAVCNGTAALHLSALALGVNEKSRVITTPITFAASANCVRYCNGEVYFADIDRSTYLLDLNRVEDLLKSKPKNFFTGVIPVDFAGKALNLENTRWLAERYNLWVLEDACHAPGGYFIDSKGAKQFCGNGAFSDLSIFSFHPVKHIACGEGGMITTNDHALYKSLQILRTHGITREQDLMSDNHGGWYYEMRELGFNYRLTDFQAALGNSQLKKLNEGLQRRKEIADKYSESLSSVKELVIQPTCDDGHAYHLFIVLAQNRKGLYEHLKKKNVFSQVHYIPVHLMPYYRSLGWKEGDFPVAESYYNQCLSLPIYPSLTDEELEYVIDQIKSFYK